MSVMVASLKLGLVLHIDASGQPVLVRETGAGRWTKASLWSLAKSPRSVALLLARLEAFSDRSAGHWPENHPVTLGIARALAALRAIRDELMNTPLSAAI